MANYRTHVTFNVIIALPLLCAALYFFLVPKPILMFVFVGTYLYATLFMSPDLDIADKIKLFSVRGILALPFRGYAKLFKHRGISHSFLWGSLTRILWLGVFLFLLFYLFFPLFSNKREFFIFCKQHKDTIFFGLGGICTADWIHLLVDRLS